MKGYGLSYYEVGRFLEAAPNILAECDRITHNETGERIRLPNVGDDTLITLLDEVDRGDAYSYRDFLVAAGFMAFDWEERSGLYIRGNFKEEGQEKSCAEKNTEALMRKKGIRIAAGGIIQATSDIELIHAVTGVATPTLHPCPDLCQPIMRASPIFDMDMPLITIADDGARFQAFTLGDLLDAYENDDFETLKNRNIGGKINFYEAMVRYWRTVKDSEGWKSKPSPGELAVTSLLRTSE